MAAKSPPPSESLRRLPIYTSRTVAGTIRKFDNQKSSQENSPIFEKTPSPIILLTRTPEFSRKSPNNRQSPIFSRKYDGSVNSRDTMLSCKNHQTDPKYSPTSRDICPCRTPPKNSDLSSSNLPSKIAVLKPPSPSDETTKPRTSKVDRLVQKIEQKSIQNNVTTGGGALNTASPTVRFRSPSPSLLRKTQAVINKEKCNEFYRAKHSDEFPSHPKSPIFSRKDLVGKNRDCFQKVSTFWNTPKT